MLKRLTFVTLVGIATAPYAVTYADDYTSCDIHVAVSTPPVHLNESVVFNVSSERGTNRSTTLKGGSEPFTFTHLLWCALYHQCNSIHLLN